MRSRMFRRLLGDGSARRVDRDLSGQEDEAAADDGLAHARTGLEALDLSCWHLLVKSIRAHQLLPLGPALQPLHASAGTASRTG